MPVNLYITEPQFADADADEGGHYDADDDDDDDDALVVKFTEQVFYNITSSILIENLLLSLWWNL